MTGTFVMCTLTTCNICPAARGKNIKYTSGTSAVSITFLFVGNILRKVAATNAFIAITPNLIIKSTRTPQSIITIDKTIN